MGVLVPHGGIAQGAPPILRGRVIDARTAAPLRDVNITITAGRDTIGRARTDSSGAFQSGVSAVAPTLMVHFNHIGYRIDSLTAAATLELPLRVAMVPVGAATKTLAAVVVKDSARSAFERRARRNTGGTFIRIADIEKRKPVRTSDLFRSYPGVRLDDSSGVMQLVSLRSARQGSPSVRRPVLAGDTLESNLPAAARCVLRVGMDGHLMPLGSSVDDVRPSDVQGIELYLGAATIPVEFSSVHTDAPCGIVMIWTKTGR
jgi:hypothetical protein